MKMQHLMKISLFLATATLLTCVGKDPQKAKKEQKVLQKTKVRVETVKLVPVDQTATFTATVEADQVNNIAPAMGGRIRKIYVDVGANVSRGETLVAMDASNLTQQERQVATLKKDYERYKALYEVGGISKQQLDQLKTQLDVAETALGTLGENTVLRSPVSGVVTARNYDPGDMVTQFPVLTIANINPVKVKVNVSESYYNRVVKGMPVEVEVDALRAEHFQGKVSLVHPTLNPVSHTFVVEISVPNNDRRLRPGMFSRVRMHFGTHDRPLLSDMAVLKQVGSNDRYVFVEKEGKAVYTVVELGSRMDDTYEILAGLNEGDRVIVQGNTGLIDGAEVEVIGN